LRALLFLKRRLCRLIYYVTATHEEEEEEEELEVYIDIA